MRFIPHVGVNPIWMGDAAATKANCVIGFPLTVSTQRMISITSKATVSDEASVVPKSRSEERSQKPKDLTLKSQEGWVVLPQERPHTLKNALLRNIG